MHIMHVIGARPNFMKIAPVANALKNRPDVQQTIVHTGQHYDERMSDVFFRQLGIPKPDLNLEVGSATHAVQTARIMERFESVLLERRPDTVLVYGDVNSTMAAALVCAKRGVRIAHVEAGLRSRDRTMPEEINRLVTDQLSDLLFTPSQDGDVNLRAEGIPAERIHFVGNVMIDTLIRLLPQSTLPRIDGLSSEYALVTLHRPSNVDAEEQLLKILETLGGISHQCQVVFPVHPRTRNRIASLGWEAPKMDRFLLVEPVGYLEFIALQKQAKMVLTDSGGIQEETTYLGVPCLTLRENTERPVTVEVGTNTLVGGDMPRLRSEVDRILAGKAKTGQIPQGWDGGAAERIAQIVLSDTDVCH